MSGNGLPLARLHRVVDQATFDKIECNRCGSCCERFFLPPLATITDRLKYAGIQYAEATDEETVGDRRLAQWLLAIEPNEEDAKDTYRCPFVRFAPDGVATCTNYDERPWACHAFPYGAPVSGFPSCPWGEENVAVFDPEPLIESAT